MKRDLLSVLSLADHLPNLLVLASQLKEEPRPSNRTESFRGKTLGMLFEKPSTRTRVSFEVAMAQLGGSTVQLNPQELQLGRGETVKDTAKTLSRYLDFLVYRAHRHESVVEFAQSSTIPVINGLDDRDARRSLDCDFLRLL